MRGFGFPQEILKTLSQSRSTARGPGLVPLTCLRSHVLPMFCTGIPPRAFPVNTSHVGQGEAGQEKSLLARRQEQGWALPPTVQRVSPPGSHMKRFLHALATLLLPRASCTSSFSRLRPTAVTFASPLLTCPVSHRTPVLKGAVAPDCGGGVQDWPPWESRVSTACTLSTSECKEGVNPHASSASFP